MYASSTRREEAAEPITSVAVEQTASGPVVSAMDELGNAIQISSHTSGAAERAHTASRGGEVRITMTGPRGAGSFLVLSREVAEELVEQLEGMLRELRRAR